MSRYIFSKNNRWYISQVFDPSDSQLQEKASYYTLTDDITGPYYATGTSDSVSIGVSYVPVVEPVGVSLRAGVIVSDSGILKVQPLSFDGTIPSDSGALYRLSDSSLLIFETGHEQPDYGGSVVPGTSMDFYKCTYVSSDSSMTWNGRKAVLNDGIYSFESNSTEGLTYGSGYTPEVGKIYTDGALARAFLYDGIPLDGLVFYAPLSESVASAQTGQTLIYAGNYSFSTYQGIQAMNLQSGCVSVSAIAQSGLDNGFALSMWICNANWNATSVIAHMGAWDGSYQQWWGMQSDNGISRFYYQPGISAGSRTNLQADTWYHVVYQQSNGVAKAWVNGVEDMNIVIEFSAVACSGKPLYLGSIGGNPSSYPLNGYIAAVRIYNRALSAAEIAALAAEFTV